MTKQQKAIAFPLLAIGAAAVSGWIVRDLWLRAGTSLECGDGLRRKIDLRDFVNEYSAVSVTFEAEVQGRGKVVTKLRPEQAVQLSDAIREAAEFRKFVVAGFNACAVSRQQYSKFGASLQVMDTIERRIDRLAQKTSLDSAESRELDNLVKEFIDTAKGLRE